jgi:hypothetical protein
VFATSIAFSAFQRNGIKLAWEEAKGISKWVNLQGHVTRKAQKEFAKRKEKLQVKVKEANEEEKKQLTRRSLLSEEDYVTMKLKRMQQFEAGLPMKLRREARKKI